MCLRCCKMQGQSLAYVIFVRKKGEVLTGALPLLVRECPIGTISKEDWKCALQSRDERAKDAMDNPEYADDMTEELMG